jgi:hypothetical protein
MGHWPTLTLRVVACEAIFCTREETLFPLFGWLHTGFSAVFVQHTFCLADLFHWNAEVTQQC